MTKNEKLVFAKIGNKYKVNKNSNNLLNVFRVVSLLMMQPYFS